MTLNRMPTCFGEKLVISIAVIFAMPAVMIASGLLLLDRSVGTHFFNPAEGGDVLLYQHLFWFFGHPEVYIIFSPAPDLFRLCRDLFHDGRIFGYHAIVLSLIATGFLGVRAVGPSHVCHGVRLHLGESFFHRLEHADRDPERHQFFCWMATLWYRQPQLTIPLLWCFGFFFVLRHGRNVRQLCSLGPRWICRCTILTLSSRHFHYVLVGGARVPACSPPSTFGFRR